MNQLLSVLFVLCIILGFFTYDFYGDSSRSQAAYQSVLAEEANLRQSLKDEQDRESAANAKISDLEQKLAKAQQAASSGPGGDNGTPPPLTITNSSGKVFTLNQADYGFCRSRRRWTRRARALTSGRGRSARASTT
jgi:hypothetical protein